MPRKLLQGLVTNDMALLGAQPALYAGLLTPQGKILFDFFVVPAAMASSSRRARDKAADLVKRLTLYSCAPRSTSRTLAPTTPWPRSGAATAAARSAMRPHALSPIRGSPASGYRGI